MIIDSSAIVAIALNEPEATRLASAILQAPDRFMSAVNWFETMMVLEARGGIAASDGALLILSQLSVATLPFSPAQMREAQHAWRRYGKGRHPAALNLGDCCAYAAAKTEGLPLLFKGADFAQTDISIAAW